MKVLVNGKNFLPLEKAMQAIMNNRVEGGNFGFSHPFFSPGGYGDCWWEIDTSAAAEGYSWHDFAFAKGIMENFIAVQKEDGRIPLYGYDILPQSEHHPKQSENASALPVLLNTIFNIAKRSSDRKFQEQAYQLMIRYIGWWLNDRQDKKTGLITSLFEETFPPYLAYAGEYCGVDTNVIVADGIRRAASLARHLGYLKDADSLENTSRDIFSAVNQFLWDDENSLFRPLDLKTGKFGPKSAEGFYMFLDPNMTENRSTRLLASLKDDNFGWDQFPVTSMAKSDASFTLTKTDQYLFNASWSGMVWTLINRYITEGLIEKGYFEDAAYLAEKTVGLLNDTAREFYAPDDGKGYGAVSYAWSGAHAIDLFIRVVCGIDYNAWERTLKIRPRTNKSVEICNLSLGENESVDVSIENNKVKCNVKTPSDNPIAVLS